MIDSREGVEADGLFALSEPRVDFLILADRAEIVAGKLYVMGGAWDQLFIQDVTLPAWFSVAVGVEVPWNATNEEHQVRLVLEDTDGHEIVPLGDSKFVVGRPPWAVPNTPQRVTFAVPIVAVTFPRLDSYVLRAFLNGVSAKRVTFRAMKAQPLMGLAPPQPS